MEKLIEKYEARKAELIAQSEKSEDVAEVRRIHKELETLNDTITDLRKAQEKSNDDGLTEREREEKKFEERKGAGYIPQQSPRYIPGKGFIPAENRGVDVEYKTEFERREAAGQALKEDRSAKSPIGIFGELRTVTVTPPSGQSATIVVPKYDSATINPDFNVVSSLVDGVAHLSLNGGESFKQPYVTGIPAGNYTTEGQNAASAETTFGYAEINRTKITAYAEITEELQKLPNAPYADVVFQNIRTSLRELLTKQILVGAGGTNQIVGIFSSNATAIDSSTDLSLSAITDTTLDEILFNYGGDENVESSAVLVLNKLDLLAFSKVRTSTKQKFYDISYNGNSGRINGVPFIINSACKALTAASGTNVGDYCMAYGHFSNYQLVEFAAIDVKRSNDYKFREGLTCFKGSCFFGGNVVRKNGFIRVKKAASL